jgi:hypothetical protein
MMIPRLWQGREELSGFGERGLGADATGWCKELKALPILNLRVTSRGLFHKVFNKAVEN